MQGIKSIIFQAQRKQIRHSLSRVKFIDSDFEPKTRIVQCKFMTKHIATESVEKGKQWPISLKSESERVGTRLII